MQKSILDKSRWLTAQRNHNDLNGLQGGGTDEYYHFLLAEYTELHEWLDNVTLGSDGSTSVPALETYTLRLIPSANAPAARAGSMYYNSALNAVYVWVSSLIIYKLAYEKDCVLVADTDASGYGFFIDEDDMATDSDTKVPSQQSVKAYVDNNVGGVTFATAAVLGTL